MDVNYLDGPLAGQVHNDSGSSQAHQVLGKEVATHFNIKDHHFTWKC